MDIRLDFKCSPSWKSRSRQADLSTADEAALRYDHFLGDVVMRLDGLDLSTNWEWIPVLDFALGLEHCVQELEGGARESRFEFTESDQEILFRREESDAVRVSGTYADGSARLTLRQLRDAADAFLRHVCLALRQEWPELATNLSFQRLSPERVGP